jgi:hypothetical protein
MELRGMPKLFHKPNISIVTIILGITLTVVLATFVLYIIFLHPHVDKNSMSSGFSVISSTLGVLLGAVLVVIILMIEQKENADIFLRHSFPKYYDYIKAKIGLIAEELNEFTNEINSNIGFCLEEVIIEERISNYNCIKFKDLTSNLSLLALILGYYNFHNFNDLLKKLGYKNDEIEGVEKKQFNPKHYPIDFLQLVYDTFYLNILAPFSNQEAYTMSK